MDCATGRWNCRGGDGLRRSLIAAATALCCLPAATARAGGPWDNACIRSDGVQQSGPACGADVKNSWSRFWDDRMADWRRFHRHWYEEYQEHHPCMLYPQLPVEWTGTYGYHQTRWRPFPFDSAYCPPSAYCPQYSQYPQNMAPVPPAAPDANEPQNPGGNQPTPDDNYLPAPVVPPLSDPEPMQSEDPVQKPTGESAGLIQLYPVTPETHTPGPAAAPLLLELGTLEASTEPQISSPVRRTGYATLVQPSARRDGYFATSSVNTAEYNAFNLHSLEDVLENDDPPIADW